MRNDEPESVAPDASRELQARTKRFAISIVRFVRSLPRDPVAATIGHQLLRSGTSVGANYRSACRAKSRPDFINKMGIVEEEADESQYWLELLVESELVTLPKALPLHNEADELVRMVVSSIRTARKKLARSQ